MKTWGGWTPHVGQIIPWSVRASNEGWNLWSFNWSANRTGNEWKLTGHTESSAAYNRPRFLANRVINYQEAGTVTYWSCFWPRHRCVVSHVYWLPRGDSPGTRPASTPRSYHVGYMWYISGDITIYMTTLSPRAIYVTIQAGYNGTLLPRLCT